MLIKIANKDKSKNLYKIFYINKDFLTDPVTYELCNNNSKEIQEIFYREELKKV